MKLRVITNSAPSIAPNITEIRQTSPTTIFVSWKPLTLSEARGFITFYIIEYYPSPNNKKRQAPSDIMRVSVSADSSSTTIDGLDENLNYFVQVSASTSAGGGVVSSPQVVNLLRGIGMYTVIQKIDYYKIAMQVAVMAWW